MEKFKQAMLIVALIFVGLVVMGVVISFVQKPSSLSIVVFCMFSALEFWLALLFYRTMPRASLNSVGSSDIGFGKKVTAKTLLIASAVFFVLLILASMYDGKNEVDQTLANAKIATAATPRVEKTPEQIEQQKQLDIEKLVAFHKQFTEKKDKVDLVVERYKRVILHGSVLDAYDEVKKSSLELSTLDEGLKYPVLSNAVANDAILSLQHNFGNSLGVQYNILSKLEDGLNNGKIDLEDQSYIKRANPRYISYQKNMAIDLLTAYQALGVDFKEIDVDHGGLMKK